MPADQPVVITAEHICAKLRSLGVEPEDELFVHSDMRRLLAAQGSGREAKLTTVVQGLTGAVPNGTLMLPTFSYSFCRDELFDVETTPSTVGVLTEHFRGLPGVRRTLEPIFSTAIRGPVDDDWEPHLFQPGDRNCFGERSIFAYLLERDAKIVCLGIDPSVCTLVYLAEQRAAVPYRYFKAFRGEVIDARRKRTTVTARYFVRRLDAGVENDFIPLFAELEALGDLRRSRLGRAEVWVVNARAVIATARRRLTEDPAFLLATERVPALDGARG
jgi:aminoglycoside 3-N-acetyltransferase